MYIVVNSEVLDLAPGCKPSTSFPFIFFYCDSGALALMAAVSHPDQPAFLGSAHITANKGNSQQTHNTPMTTAFL
jgi:hypothetical protein